jgi:D-glycero-D-manno-heptose 1,7-bisphosphate phosphatase
MSRALFLDRDGTLIYDKRYLCEPADVEIIPGVPDALRAALDAGYLLFLFTNQSGISRRYYSIEDVRRVNTRMEELIGLNKPLFTGECIAPELPEEPQLYRKPSPRFIVETIEKHGLSPADCYMVGDKRADILAGVNAGITPIMVLTGKDEDPSDFPELHEYDVAVFDSFADFVKKGLRL